MYSGSAERQSVQYCRPEVVVSSGGQEYLTNDKLPSVVFHDMESLMALADNESRRRGDGKHWRQDSEDCSLAIGNYLDLLALCSPSLLKRSWTLTHPSGFNDVEQSTFDLEEYMTTSLGFTSFEEMRVYFHSGSNCEVKGRRGLDLEHGSGRS